VFFHTDRVTAVSRTLLDIKRAEDNRWMEMTDINHGKKQEARIKVIYFYNSFVYLSNSSGHLLSGRCCVTAGDVGESDIDTVLDFWVLKCSCRDRHGKRHQHAV
jgi:hypothetical protein